MKKTVLVLMAAALLCFNVGAQSKKAAFPKKPVTLVVGFNPGGASDLVSRMIAESMQKTLGVPVVVVNKPGATGSIALEYVRNSKKDGYTVCYMPVESTMVKALGYTNVQPSDFYYLGRVMTLPAAITVKADAPWKTIEEFLAYATKNPGKVTVGNSGTGSIWQVAAASVEDKTGIKFNHVPFDGAAPAIAGLLGGHIDAVACSASEVLPNVKGGLLRVLAVMSDERSPLLPDVPTMKERKIDVSVVGWGGFAVPAGTPAPVCAVLENAVKIAFGSAGFQQLCTERSMVLSYLDAKSMNTYAQGQYAYFSTLMPKLGIK